jgi:phytanoyl-CoA hydroxylase
MNPQTLKRTFEDQGYLIVEDVLDAERDLAPIRADYTALLDEVAAMAVANGHLDYDYGELPFEQRMAAVLQHATTNLYRYFDIALPNEVLSPDSPVHVSRAVYDLIRTPALLDVAEALVGPELLANPIQHIRLKPPQRQQLNTDQSSLVATTGWHQDMGVARDEADGTEMLTFWLAITDATVENGCLQVVPYSHRAGLADHCPDGLAVEIPAQRLSGEPRPIELRAGSVLVMHRLTQHASLPNLSDGIRWSFDLRYQPLGQPTGRDELPGLVVRSEREPLTTYEAWVAAWHAARDALAEQDRGKMHRWDSDSPACA